MPACRKPQVALRRGGLHGRQFGGHNKMGVCFPMDRCREGNGGCEQTCNSQNGEALCSCKCAPGGPA